jgi:hypothetical protein
MKKFLFAKLHCLRLYPSTSSLGNTYSTCSRKKLKNTIQLHMTCVRRIGVGFCMFRYFQDLFIVIMRCVFPSKRASFHHRYFGKVSQQVPLPEMNKNCSTEQSSFYIVREKEYHSKAELNSFYRFELKASISRTNGKISLTNFTEQKNSSHFTVFRNTRYEAKIVQNPV